MKYSTERPPKRELARRAVRRARERGPAHVVAAAARSLRAAARRGIDRAWVRTYAWLLRARPATTFSFRGDTYQLFRHHYNATWRNERAVELPIVRRAVERAAGGSVLEIGNVLGHYFPRDHDVVDKYESGEGVMNVDAADYRPGKRYDLIVSISTLEHVGWDDEPRDPPKALATVEHLRGLLAPRGKALLTVPVGYNPFLDAALGDEAAGFDRQHYLERRGPSEWREVARPELRGVRYGAPFRGANVLVVGEIDGPLT